MFDDIIDNIKEGFGSLVDLDRMKDSAGILVSDIPRFLAIFVVSGIIIGLLAAVNIAPNFTGFVNNPDMQYCNAPYNNVPAVLQQNFVLTPVFTYLFNPPLGQAEMACVFLSGNYILIAVYYVEMTLLLILGAWIGIMVLNLSG